MNERYEKGLQKLNELHKGLGKQVMQRLKGVSPDFEKLTTEFAYGEIYSRPGLDVRSRQIATVAALCVLGNGPLQLKAHLNAALNIGISYQELEEVILQMSLYGGFHTAQNAMFLLNEVASSREP